MKNYIFFTFCLFSLIFFTRSGYAQQNPKVICVSVKDVDKQPLIGAVVMLENENAVTDKYGIAYLKWHIGSKAHLMVEYVGMKKWQETLVYSELTNKEIEVVLENESLEGVFVSAEKTKTENTTIAVRLSSEKLKDNGGRTLASVLESIPGMSSISTGATIMKPVIQGMHSSRILLINNDVRQEGQQWGADHAPEVDVSSATDLEVIKGAESIRYGSGAVGGVIRLKTASLPTSSDPGGRFTLKTSTNSGSFGGNADIYGGSNAFKGFKWRAQMSANRSGDYKTAEYVLNNTGTKEGSMAFAAGLKKKGFVLDVFANMYYSELGVFYGSHIGTLDDLLERFKVGRPLATAPATYKIEYPKQQILHSIVRLTGEYLMGYAGKIKVQYDYQNDIRNEYERRPGKFSLKPSMGLTLNTHSGNVSWESDEHIPFRVMAGLSFMLQNNTSRNDTGSVPLIPNFASLSSGAYLIAKYIKPKYELATGFRYDYKYLNSVGYDYLGNEYGGVKHFQSPSFSVSGLYRPVNGLTMLTNFGLAWRAPDVNELYSNGLHHGAAAYEVGDSSLKPEAAYKWNNEVRYAHKYFSVSGTGFIQFIGNYIFDAPQKDPNTGLPETRELIAGVFPIFRYKQVDARFYGGDVAIAVKPLSWLTYNAQAQWVRAVNSQTGGYFPYIPADRYEQSIECKFKSISKHLDNIAFNVGYLYVAKQRRFDPSIDFISETPPAYHLLGAGINFGFPLKPGRIELNVTVSNVLNSLYKEYTNRFRYYAHEKGRDVRLSISYKF